MRIVGKMAAELERTLSSSSKRLLMNEKHICSKEPGPRGLTYDETNVVYSLLWNQPYLQPSQYSYSHRHDNPLVRRGGQAEVKTASVGLPIFYTDSPDQPLSENESEGGSEIHEMNPSIIKCVRPWRKRMNRTVDYIMPSNTEEDIATRVKSELGYKFPPIMNKMIEANIQRKWLKWTEKGMIVDGHREDEYLQLVVDTHVFMAREIERRLSIVNSCDSDMDDNQPTSQPTSQSSLHEQLMSDESTTSDAIPQTKKQQVRSRKRKKKKKMGSSWDRTLPQTTKVIKSQRHETVQLRLKQQQQQQQSYSIQDHDNSSSTTSDE